MGAKMTRAESNEVVERAKFLIVTALKDSAIVKAIGEQFKIQPQQANTYLKRAHNILRTEKAPERQSELNKAIGRYNFILQGSLSKGDYKTALKAQAQLDKIFGLIEPDKLEISGKDGAPLFSGFNPIILKCRDVLKEHEEKQLQIPVTDYEIIANDE